MDHTSDMGPFRRKLVRVVAEQLRCPKDGVIGYCVLQKMKRDNRLLQQAAVAWSDIQPHHQVLEVGFGAGLGIKEAYQKVKDGSGCIHGIDHSKCSFDTASSYLKRELRTGKVNLSQGDVKFMEYPDHFFDAAYHVNSYYFWVPMKVATAELYRVLKPGAKLVTTLDHQDNRDARDKGLFPGAVIDPLHYMFNLENTGFQDVKMEYHTKGEKEYQCITARAWGGLSSESDINDEALQPDVHSN